MDISEWIYNSIMGALVLGSSLMLLRWRKAWLGVCLAVLCGGAGFALPLVLSTGIFGLLRLWCWGLFVHAVIWLLAGAALSWRASRGLTALCAVPALLVTMIAIDAFLIEPSWLDVTTIQLQSPRIQKPVRIAILADIQTDRITKWEQSVFATVMKSKPDILLIAGDTLQVGREGWAKERAAFRRIWKETEMAAPLGTVVVAGNTDASAWPTLYQGLGVHIATKTETFDLGPLMVTGLSEAASFDSEVRVSRPDDRYHIVLGHSPDFALGQVDGDLLVAGHTHGGQVQIPFFGPIFTFSSIPRDWAHGMTQISDLQTLIVSRGIGMERFHAPRLRFWCRPQVVILDLVPEKR